MKYLKYQHCTRVNRGTETEPFYEENLCTKILSYNEANEEIAKKEAHNGEYTIEDDGVSTYPVAPRNIEAGEYVTISGVLYLATDNIPNGEPIIVGQNAVITSVEKQLYELTKED